MSTNTPRPRPFCLAIAGGSGSGKTSLTRALVDIIGADRCAVLDHDSYYRDLSHQPTAVRAATNFDHPKSLENELLAEHIQSLRAGRSIDRPRYDFRTHCREQDTERVEARPVIICEGILLLAVPELRNAFDLRIFIDTPADVRALRRVQRDVVERGRTITSVVQQYLTTVRPMHEQFVQPASKTSHVVLSWQQTSAEQARTVLAELRDRPDVRPLTVGG